MSEKNGQNAKVQIAKQLRSLGQVPVHVLRGEKKPIERGWQKLTIEDVSDKYIHERWFDGEANIGLLLGVGPNYVVDVDLDSQSAVESAKWVLDPTTWVSGRDSKPNSHYFFTVSSPVKSRQFRGRDRHGEQVMLLELRSQGGQTVLPPSVHPSGETYRWENAEVPAGLPPHADAENLNEQCEWIAAITQLMEFWPGAGSRHHAYLALAGMLALGEFPIADATRLCEILIGVSADDEAEDRLTTITSSYSRYQAGEAVQGSDELRKVLNCPIVVVENVKRWLRLKGNPAPASKEPIRIKAKDAFRNMLIDHIKFWKHNGVIWAKYGQQVVKVRGKEFRGLLRTLKKDSSIHLSSYELKDLVESLLEELSLTAPEKEMVIRIGGTQSEIWLNRMEDGERILIDTKGWTIKTESPILFIEPRGDEPLPRPVAGGSISELWDLLSVVDASDRRLLEAWLVGQFNPVGPKPILVLVGPEDSGKSTLAKLVSRLVAPTKNCLRYLPRRVQDLAVATNSSCLLVYDNVSHISDEMADALCQTCTGGTHACRELYTDDQEVFLSLECPIILACISVPTSRSDLIDRMIVIEIPSIGNDQRKTVAQLELDFESVRPRVLGAILDRVSRAMSTDPDLLENVNHRLADFSRFAMASCSAEDRPNLKADLEQVREHALSDAAEDSILYDPVLAILRASPDQQWVGTSTELLKDLTKMAARNGARGAGTGVPRSANALSAELRRVAKSFKTVGIQITQLPRLANSRRWHLQLMSN